MRLLRPTTIGVAVSALLFSACRTPEASLSQAHKPFWRHSPPPVPTNVKDAPPTKIHAVTYFSAARLFQSQGLLAKAEKKYRKAIALDPNYVEAYHRLGLLRSALGKRDEAITLLQRAVTLRPDDAVLQNNLGFVLLLEARWNEAEEAFGNAVRLNPRFPRAAINLGVVQSRLGRFDDALASFRSVLSEADAYYNLGLMYRGQEKFAQARDAFEKALSVAPRLKAARVQLEQIAPKLRGAEGGKPDVRVAASGTKTSPTTSPTATRPANRITKPRTDSRTAVRPRGLTKARDEVLSIDFRPPDEGMPPRRPSHTFRTGRRSDAADFACPADPVTVGPLCEPAMEPPMSPADPPVWSPTLPACAAAPVIASIAEPVRQWPAMVPDHMVSTQDSFALVRELTSELARVRAELDCLDEAHTGWRGRLAESRKAAERAMMASRSYLGPIRPAADEDDRMVGPPVPRIVGREPRVGETGARLIADHDVDRTRKTHKNRKRKE